MKNNMLFIFRLGLRSIAWAIVKDWIRRRFPDVQSVSTTALQTWLQEGMTKPLLLDVRTPAEYEVSHLPQARRAPDDPAALSQWSDVTPTTPIVAYCSVGYRSARLARQLQAMGYETVFNLEGSIFQWANEGKPVYQGGKAVKQVHPYDRLWGCLLEPSYRS